MRPDLLDFRLLELNHKMEAGKKNKKGQLYFVVMLAVFDVHFTTLVCKNYSLFPVLCLGPEQTFPVLLIFLAKHRKVKYGQLPQKDITLVR